MQRVGRAGGRRTHLPQVREEAVVKRRPLSGLNAAALEAERLQRRSRLQHAMAEHARRHGRAEGVHGAVLPRRCALPGAARLPVDALVANHRAAASRGGAAARLSRGGLAAGRRAAAAAQ
jgi:hypothetical protein